MRIALDCMGTDGAPASEIAGAFLTLQEQADDLTFVLVGDRVPIEEALRAAGSWRQGAVEVVHAPERVLPEDPPAQTVRRRPNSSIVTGIRLQKEGEVDAFVSAGSTGAVMATSLILLRPLPGVARPAIGTLLPTAAAPTLMLDAGANVDCKPHHLLQFASLGAIYAQDLMGVDAPRVGLLNIGEEPTKGDELSLEAFALLKQSNLHFVGNVEGRDIIRGVCDVLVCDGFVGNVLLKFYESVAAFTIKLLTRETEREGARMDLEEVLSVLDYAEYGGAPLLGVNGVSIICHGHSIPRAIHNAIRVAAQAVRTDMVGHIARDLRGEVDPGLPGPP
ncbi:MAG: phosphate acyltransferase PlsX [Gammaproteobacteria bacterium]|nr:phosphate acyltransferase PlsX [Gammaproteobacteria bacterium]MDE0246743.1 phosphate acyltransferase PlsX [Gammaproteobacteria bacterium]